MEVTNVRQHSVITTLCLIQEGVISHAKGIAHQNDGTARGRVEIASPELEPGQTVDVVVTRPSSTERRSVVDILAEAPGGLVFKTPADVAAYLKEEKEAWGR